ncbi:MAG TPA: CheR family methyltransferase [Candidatus Dormibacteraeota bacterium]|jgi:two-component system CheB/CheR fusion protein|nr:CheR family methyltransferase [Candidatus Dormibacteraeota bacterium]
MKERVTDDAFEALLEFLYQTHGFDFTGYKRATLLRRVSKRVDDTGSKGFDDYLDYLQVHPEEYGILFDTILINVTSFFRDAQAWDFLQTQALPHMLAARRDDQEHFRAWSAGCASGEEAYTLAILLAETLGEEAVLERVKIYATDVDEDALARARAATYTARDLGGVPDALRDKYFEQSGANWSFRPDLRRAVIFGRHDLVQDAPISRLDLLVCRNTLMYLTAETQSRVLGRLHYALKDTGLLFLGRAEMLLTHASLFTPLDLRNRVFTRVPRADGRDRTVVLASLGQDNRPHPAVQVRLQDLAAQGSPVAEIVVDSGGYLVLANRQAEAEMGVAQRDVGRPFQDLAVSNRPVELRARIDEAYAARKQQRIPAVEIPDATDGHGPQHYDIVLTPLLDHGEALGMSIVFVDVSSAMSLQAELARSKQELETAYEELQSANEELETTNEELQSTVEELETTNEELQSANEELETMNEELQSTNSELQSINTELRDRTDQFDRASTFMERVLSSLRVGVMVVDEAMHVQLWNSRASDLWGLRAEEVVGESLLSLDMGIPVKTIATLVAQCMADGDPGERTIPARDRRGRDILCRLMCARLDGPESGTVVTMESVAPD